MKLCVLTDLHLFDDPAGQLFGVDVRSNAARAFTHARDLIARREVDGLVVAGDVSHDGSASSYEWFARQLEDIGVPCHLVPGNHDLVGGPFGAAYPRAVPLAEAWTLDLIDTRIPGNEDGRIGSGSVRHLAASMADGRHHVVVMHHDVVQEPPGARPGVVSGAAAYASLLASTRSNHQTVLTVCGHRHRWLETSLEGQPYVNAGATSCRFSFDSEGRASMASDRPEVAELSLAPEGGVLLSRHRVP